MIKYKKIARTLALILSVFIINSFINYDVFASEAFTQSNNEIRLQDNFYETVNKEWLEKSMLKQDEEAKSTFTETKDKVNNDTKRIFNDLLIHENKYLSNTDEKKIINLYNNSINISERNNQGAEPIKKYTKKIKEAKNINELTKLLGDPTINIFSNLINFSVGSDIYDEKNNALYISSTRLVLGDSDQYRNETDKTKNNKENMEKYLVNILMLSGYSREEANKKVSNLFYFENQLASSIIGVNEFADYYNNQENNYKTYKISDINELSNNLDLSYIIKNLGYENVDKVILFEPKWLDKLNEIYNEENLQVIKDYTEVCMISAASKYLSENFRNEYLALQKSLYDIDNISLEDETKELVKKNFNSALSKLYVGEVFSEEIKSDVKNITEEIINTYSNRIKNLEWMSASTKDNAIKKLKNIKVNIGYPEEWTDYSNLEIKSYKEGGSFLENIINLEKFSYKKPVNAKESFNKISPEDVNAYYDAESNEITIPAAILQKPFYDINESKEKNLGGLGVIIGHEITHAFDNNGSKFDENGKIKNWWTDEDYKKYEDKIKRIEEVYGNIEALPGIKVNGEITLGENIADIGSMTCMLDILDNIPNANYDEFFRNFATVWRDITTEEYKVLLLKIDSHSPSDIRVNTVLQQFEKFYEIYNVTENDDMYIRVKDRLSIW
ncbi:MULTISPECIES: M13 family metallopeptidase [unclassified Clostridium]|uniref:M13-type metalloendopeptidase n=1 Tax=unclassified Clostridium TaxID=2614128 RepID=UPI0013EE61E5|nr:MULTISPECIES: M13 family metallopeptidase [unclassified Clostridium]MBN1039619.1 M13 family peptidase [Clostridium botulinum]MBZ9692672.1 M13 family metallopeptidase [Clostridium sp. M14]NFR85296.1 M13 family metallopeptidase [Clostridium botulinum]NFR89589.1 M13 family metallopeptidase [Clostridium botulinum]NFT98231.1 M13 family metallopeptidase [Clostridium botulinum]